MSKIEPNKINFNEDDFVVAVDVSSGDNVTQKDLEKNRIEAIKAEMMENAEQEAKKIINIANAEKEDILKQADDVLLKAKEDAKNLVIEAEKNSKEEIEKQKTESANLGYKEGYEDGKTKIYEELEEKIEGINTFCSCQYELKNKILKSASRDILDIIQNISKRILIKELDGLALEKIIQKTVTLFEKKENINIILSEKYARLLFEYQKKSLGDEVEFKFEDFKQFENFNIMYNPKLSDDTIIIENMKERFDASLGAQLDIIFRDILENTSNGQLEDIEEYGNDEA